MPLLFSYGTLRQPDVQRSTFGRLLRGYDDELVGFEPFVHEVADAAFVASSGTARHAMIRFTGEQQHRVRGMVFEVSDDELAAADRYEPAGYARVAAPLASGETAWVYVEAKEP